MLQDHVLLCEGEDPKSDLKGELLSPVPSPHCSPFGRVAWCVPEDESDCSVPLPGQLTKNKQGRVYCREDLVFEEGQGNGLSYV